RIEESKEGRLLSSSMARPRAIRSATVSLHSGRPDGSLSASVGYRKSNRVTCGTAVTVMSTTDPASVPAALAATLFGCSSRSDEPCKKWGIACPLNRVSQLAVGALIPDREVAFCDPCL